MATDSVRQRTAGQCDECPGRTCGCQGEDDAARRHNPADLAAALVALATAGSRPTALTAGGPAAIARIQRLLTPPPRPGLPTRTALVAAGLAGLTIPAAIACLPVAIAACAIIATA